jgi:hypothetical protein
LGIAEGPTKGIGCTSFFADISKGENMSSRKFSKSAPKWRMVCPGLNTEGYCRNSSCSAFNDLVVDSSHSMGRFDLISDECKCPQCGHVLPVLETCGFYHCQWKYSGLQKTDQGPRVVAQKEWITSSKDKYDRFKEASKGAGVTWARLVIQTRSPPAEDIQAKECGICFEPVECDRHATACRHLFHASCLAPWLNKSNTCPTCRAQVTDKPAAHALPEAVAALQK